MKTIQRYTMSATLWLLSCAILTSASIVKAMDCALEALCALEHGGAARTFNPDSPELEQAQNLIEQFLSFAEEDPNLVCPAMHAILDTVLLPVGDGKILFDLETIQEAMHAHLCRIMKVVTPFLGAEIYQKQIANLYPATTLLTLCCKLDAEYVFQYATTDSPDGEEAEICSAMTETDPASSASGERAATQRDLLFKRFIRSASVFQKKEPSLSRALPSITNVILKTLLEAQDTASSKALPGVLAGHLIGHSLRYTERGMAPAIEHSVAQCLTTLFSENAPATQIYLGLRLLDKMAKKLPHHYRVCIPSIIDVVWNYAPEAVLRIIAMLRQGRATGEEPSDLFLFTVAQHLFERRGEQIPETSKHGMVGVCLAFLERMLPTLADKPSLEFLDATIACIRVLDQIACHYQSFFERPELNAIYELAYAGMRASQTSLEDARATQIIFEFSSTIIRHHPMAELPNLQELVRRALALFPILRTTAAEAEKNNNTLLLHALEEIAQAVSLFFQRIAEQSKTLPSAGLVLPDIQAFSAEEVRQCRAKNTGMGTSRFNLFSALQKTHQ